MAIFSSLLVSLLCLLGSIPLVRTQQVVIPASNGTYTVGRVTLQMTNEKSIQPFGPTQDEAPVLELSVFYPTDANETVPVPYMPAEVARYIDVELSTQYSIDTPNGTLERLVMQLAPDNSTIAQSPMQTWPLLVFGSGLNNNRNFYNILVSQIASLGYVVITLDTPYDTDIVLYSNGSTTLINAPVWADTNETTLIASIIADNNVRAQDTSSIIDKFSNTSFVSSIIPGCTACLNTTHVGVFGHSLGGAAASTTAINDTRVSGAINYDGTNWGAEVQQGLTKPFFLFVEEGSERTAFNGTPAESWSLMWPKLSSAKFDLMVNKTRHSTFSDYPIVFDLLNITLPPPQGSENDTMQEYMFGPRALNIVSTYTVAFFDWLLKNGTADLVAAPNPLFPEISLDTDTTSIEEAASIKAAGFGNATQTTAV